MEAMMKRTRRVVQVPRWMLWAFGALATLYIVGYVDGTVHAAILGDAGLKLDYVHEFFHHARHVALMCH